MDWSGVRDRVAAVERVRGRWSPHSRWQLFERVLTAEEIAAVEAEIGVSFPEEYAAFLAEVGSGGPGPTCGLTTLCQVEGRWAWDWEGTSLATDPRGPFLENDEWVGHQIAALRAAGFEPTLRDEVEDYLGDYVTVFGGDDGFRLFHEHRFCGSVQICDYGCGMTGWLVMAGPHRGEVWFCDVGTNMPLEQLRDASGRPYNFYTWYLEWLEREEAGVGIGAPWARR